MKHFRVRTCGNKGYMVQERVNLFFWADKNHPTMNKQNMYYDYYFKTLDEAIKAAKKLAKERRQKIEDKYFSKNRNRAFKKVYY